MGLYYRNGYLIRSCVLLYALSISLPARAMAVFDGANFGKNTITSIQSLKTAAVAVQQDIKLAIQIQQALRNMKPGMIIPAVLGAGVLKLTGDIDSLQDVAKAFKDVNTIYDTYKAADDLLGETRTTMKVVKGWGDETNKLSLANKKTWKDFLSSGGQMADYQLQQAQIIQGSLSKLGKRFDALVKEMPRASGTTEAMTQVGQALALQNETFARLVTLAATDAESRATQYKIEEAKKKATMEQNDTFRKGFRGLFGSGN